MKYSILVLGLMACHGCIEPVTYYTPQGTGAKDGPAFRTLMDSSPCIFLWPSGFRENPAGDDEKLWENWQSDLEKRPTRSGFRSLCALINRYWGNWDRLIIIERFGYGGDQQYSFVAAGISNGNVKVVANWHTGEWSPNESYVQLSALTPNREQFQGILKVLDDARTSLPERFLFLTQPEDRPIYIVHDIKRGEDSFVFGLSGIESVRTEKDS